MSSSCSPDSNGSVFSYIGKGPEGDLSRKLLSLTIEKHSESDDSFNFCPETMHNKGYLEFLKLLEDFYAKKDLSDSFADSVVQMLDLDVSNKVATSQQIQAMLNEKGWNVRAMSQIWSVAPAVTYRSSLDGIAMEMLGAKESATLSG